MAHLYSLIKGNSICQLVSLGDAAYNPEPLIKAMADFPDLKLIQILMFSDNENYRNGKTLAKYIKENNLGCVKETTPERSLNTGNQINTWMWHIDKQALKNWNDKRALKKKEYIALGINYN